MINERETNKILFNVANHLMAASALLRELSVFDEEAYMLINYADQFSQLIKPYVSKVSEDRMMDIFNQISAVNTGATQR